MSSENAAATVSYDMQYMSVSMKSTLNLATSEV